MSENVSQNSIIETQNHDNSPSTSDSENELFEDMVPLSEQEEEKEMASSNIKFPPFYETEPEMWFDQVDTILECKGIKTPDEKFKILHGFGGETHVKFTYRIKKDKTSIPNGSSQYEVVKSHIINAYSQSEESRLQKLFKSEKLSGIKPQQRAIRLRKIASGDFSKAALRSLFLTSLQRGVRKILCICEIEDLDKLATVADRIMANANTPVQTVNKIERTDNANLRSSRSRCKDLPNR